MYEDNYLILEALTPADIHVDLDLFFDRFRWAELSLGFAHTGSSENEKLSLGLWELNDATHEINSGHQIIRLHVNARSTNGRLPLRPLFATWDLTLPAHTITAIQTISLKSLYSSTISPLQRDPLPDFYSKQTVADPDNKSWGSAVSLIDQLLDRYGTAQRGRITLNIEGTRIKEHHFHTEGFRPGAISHHFDSLLNAIPQKEWSVTATLL